MSLDNHTSVCVFTLCESQVAIINTSTLIRSALLWGFRWAAASKEKTTCKCQCGIKSVAGPKKRVSVGRGCNSIWRVITSFLTYCKMYSNISQRNASTSCGSAPAHWLGHNHTLKCSSNFTVSIKWKLGLHAVAICNLRKKVLAKENSRNESQSKQSWLLSLPTPAQFQIILLLGNSGRNAGRLV